MKPHITRLVVVAVLILTFIGVERRSTAGLASPVQAIAGLALAGTGLMLHFRARRALGRSWSNAVAVRPGRSLVTHGPYGHVRHPLYLAILLLAAGTTVAHPSPGTACLAGGLLVGLGIKLRREERALEAAFGSQWTDYAARVPALGFPPSGWWRRRGSVRPGTARL